MNRSSNQFKVQSTLQAEAPQPEIPKNLLQSVGPSVPTLRRFPSGYCVYSKFAYGEVKDPLKLYRGKDCLEKFCNYIRQEAHRLYRMFPEKPMDPFTKKQWKKYRKSTICHICFKPFIDSKKGPKVCDHCHYTGHYRGPAHRNCNLMYRMRDSKRGLLGQNCHFSSIFLSSITNPIIFLFSIPQTPRFNYTLVTLVLRKSISQILILP